LVENLPDSGIVIIEMGIIKEDVECSGCRLVDFFVVVIIIPGFEVKSGLIVDLVNSLEAAYTHLVGAVWEFDKVETRTIEKTNWTFLSRWYLTKCQVATKLLVAPQATIPPASHEIPRIFRSAHNVVRTWLQSAISLMWAARNPLVATRIVLGKAGIPVTVNDFLASFHRERRLRPRKRFVTEAFLTRI